MTVSKKLIKFLEDKKIKYELLEHRVVYTGHDKAATLRIEPKMVGKTLVIKFDKGYGLVLIPVNKLLCLKKAKKSINAWLKKKEQKSIKKIDFVKESWMKKNLKGVKVGAVPPFGEIWKLVTFVDRSLMKSKKLIVNAGDYSLSFKLSPSNLKKVDDLVETSFSKPRPKKKKKKVKKKKKKR